jgi:hypothetical protein
VTEAIFTGEQIEEFAGGEITALAAAALTKFARLAKNLFVGDRPGDTRDGEGQEK